MRNIDVLFFTLGHSGPLPSAVNPVLSVYR